MFSSSIVTCGNTRHKCHNPQHEGLSPPPHPPKIMCLAINLHKHLVQMPLPIRIRTHLANSLTTDLGGEHRSKSVPPKSYSFVADIDPTLVEQVLHIPERQWEANVQHHG